LTCGAKLDIVEGSVAAGTKRILIEGSERINDNDTWGVYSDEDGLVLAGTAKRSALYAVYYFLENYLDWRFFTSDCETVYEHHEIDLANIDKTYKHQYTIRGLYAYDYSESWISVKRYFNESSKRNLSAEQGGMEGFTYMGIHNFGDLAGVDSENGQPCLNDQQVLDNILNSTIAYLDAHPGTPSVHISQEDNNNYCKCDKCQADIDYYGAPSGSIIEMLNYVCEGLEDYKGGIYKDVKVITFIYRYSFDAPENIVCHDNIVVEYTIIDLCHQHAITDPECNHVFEKDVLRDNAGILEEMNKWSKISKQCLIYDYGADFKFYYSAFPQFDVLRENYRYFSTIGAWGYMNLCNPHQPGCDFSELRFYLYAKLLEDPNMTEEQYQTHIDEFLAAYYGPGWENMRAYLDWTIEAADNNGKCYGVYSTPETIFGRNVFGPMDEQFQEWFNAALDAAETEEQKTRIRRIRISADYLAISDKFSADYKSEDPAVKQAIIDRTAKFLADLRELGLEWVTESRKLEPSYSERTKPRSF
ncbi:MAG: DUF4838 domain-containing protein, partial [Clostridia bacterium]|nr:DUF4838 domain-containing protein [Clostridia bacterium]